MIPEEKQLAVTRALREAFGTEAFEDIRPLTDGMSSALVFRIVVRETPYLLRVITRTGAMGDPTRQYACMRAGAEAGIAPRIRYASVEDRVMISDFIDPKPFPHDIALRIAPLLRRLHALPQFPKAVDYFAVINGFVRRFQTAKILPESKTEELFNSYGELAKIYPHNETELVACHNDLKPQNILFDGERIWLVDWEAAFLNDRYLDLAVVANFFVKDAAGEQEYLHAYFGEPAGDYRSARFCLMRQAAHVVYATCFMVLAHDAGYAADPRMQVPEFDDFHRRIIAGEIDLMKPEAKSQYGMVHLNRALENLRTRRFKDAMTLVSGSNTSMSRIP
jgi:aminoglycoside phosphotransferase (APT) family kinase protein